MNPIQLPLYDVFDEGDQFNEKVEDQGHKKRWYKILLLPLLLLGVIRLFPSNQLIPCVFYFEIKNTLGGIPKGAKETFEIQLPIIYNNLIHEQHVLTHSFGNSWGKAAKTTFKPAITGSKFNRVVLTLNTTVDGVQYDRLGHVFINDVPVWRTSTAEPGNELIFSTSSKDISKYLSLFQQEEVQLTFQLDNLIRGRLNGVFNTTLSIKYYLEDDNVDNDHRELSSYFQVTNRPAQRVTKLYSPNPGRTPLLYYPSDKLEYTVPIIEANTTSLKLELYISGNAAEEFWYSNVLDKYSNKFQSHGHALLGHGPVRVVNVYLDGVKISSLAPEPVIYSGGISPALWKPIIGVNAFDVKALEVDLTSFLPILWKSGGKLEIEVTNGEEKGDKIDQNWIVSSNLLHWESSEIESSFGEVENFDNSTKYKFFAIETSPENLYQTVLSNHSADIYTNLTYVLYNGTQLPLKLHTTSSANFVNFQTYAQYGDYQFLAAINTNTYISEISYNNEVVAKLEREKVFPVTISILTEPVIGYDVTYEANITHVYGSTINIDESKVYNVESVQNGTSLFTLSPGGNKGFGSTDQNYKAELHYPFPELTVNETAKAVNGSVVNDYNHINTSQVPGPLRTPASELQPILSEVHRLVSVGSLSSETATTLIHRIVVQKDVMESINRDVRTDDSNGGNKPNIGTLRLFDIWNSKY